MGAKFSFVEPGTVALIQQSEDGRIMQIGITEEQSQMLQAFLGVLSTQSPLVQMGEEHDLVLKRSLCKKCQKL